MADEHKSARTTISVPHHLKAQMEAVTEPVNWSALACRAFEAKLAEIAAKKEQKGMDDIVTRLRASKRRVEDEHYQQGDATGREWVKDQAEADELMCLERWKAKIGWEWDRLFTDDLVAELVVFAVWPEHDGDRGMANHFWEEVLGDDTSAADDPQFVKGLSKGRSTSGIRSKPNCSADQHPGKPADGAPMPGSARAPPAESVTNRGMTCALV
jgi:hypothetical protein